MKNCSSDSKENTDKSHGVFLEDGINTVRKNSAINNTVDDFSFTQSNFLKLLEENIKLRSSVKELNKTLGDEVAYLKHSIFKLQKEHDENTQLLKLQAKTHFEDWEIERKEKYVAQSQVQILKNQLHLLAARFAVRDVRNRSYLYPNDSLHQPQKADHSMEHNIPSCHQEKKYRKNKSPSKMIQKNTKCSSHSSPSAPIDSPSPAANTLCASKEMKTSHVDQSAVKESTKEHSHRKIQNKVALKETQSKHNDRESTPASIREKTQQQSATSKCNVEKSKHDRIQCTTHCLESTGTKPKVPPKGAIIKGKHDNCDAKKRARTILASALPVSPVSSGPSSPIQSPTRRHSSYVPITSTVLTPASYGSSPVSDISSEESVKCRDNVDKVKCQNETQLLSPTLRTCMNKNFISSEDCNDVNDNESVNSEYSKTAVINIPDSSGMVVNCAGNFDEVASKAYQQSFYIPRVSPSDSGVSCTSITVMSGSHGPSQAASSNSSRSSSPGISLMTFALNADGKGIPGAFYFALGSDTNVSQSQNSSTVCCAPPKSSSFVATYNSDLCNIIDSENIPKNEFNENHNSEKIVNATWVRLMDKESKLLDSTKTWRTARAVPSNELFINKKNSKNEIETHKCRKIQDVDSENKRLDKHRNSQCTATDKYYFSSKDLYINSSDSNNTDDNNSGTSKISPQLSRDGNFTIINDCSNSKLDLKSLASRNISSAILSYEIASKTAVCQSKLGK